MYPGGGVTCGDAIIVRAARGGVAALGRALAVGSIDLFRPVSVVGSAQFLGVAPTWRPDCRRGRRREVISVFRIRPRRPCRSAEIPQGLEAPTGNRGERRDVASLTSDQTTEEPVQRCSCSR
jgi:hypothetical protein